MQIYLNKDGQQYGPYTLAELQQYVQAGHFTPQDHACYDGQNWVTIAQVPGLGGGGEAVATDPQSQQQVQAHAQEAQATQGQEVRQQAVAAVAVDATAKKKKIILWSSIGGAAALIVAGILIVVLMGDDEGGEEKMAEKLSVEKSASGKEDSSPVAAASISVLDRISGDALGVATLDLGGILEKGGSKAASLLPSDVPPTVKKILKDPSSVGLDVTEPVRAYFLRHPTKPDEDPTVGIAAKLSDSAKFKQSFELLANPEPAEKKDGYDLWELSADDGYLAVTEEILLFIGNDDSRADAKHLTKELERFMTSDGSNSFVKAHSGYAAQANKGYDLGIWIDLEKVGSLGKGKAPDELLGLVEAGTLSGGLRFDDGEVVLEFDGASKGLGKALGGGGISSGLAKYLAADAPLVASISMSVDALVDMFSDTLAKGANLDLDKPIKQFGIAPREVLEVFQGGFAFSLTKLPPLGGGAVMEDEPLRSEGPDGPGNFGDKGDAGPSPNPFGETPAVVDPFGGTTSPGKPDGADDPPAGGDPFGGTATPGERERAVDPPPFGGGPPPRPPSGPPLGGPPSGGPAANMPDFVLAASIDDAKWGAVMKKSPPLAGMLGMAQLMGITVKAENGILAVGSTKHASAIAGGGLPNPVGSTTKTLFTSHDFVLRITSKPLVKALMDGGMPPAFEQALARLDSLVVTADSAADGGSLSVRLSFADKRTNGLPALIDLGFGAFRMMSFGASGDPIGDGH